MNLYRIRNISDYSFLYSPNCISVLELKSNDCVRDAINLLYTKNTSGASIIDNVDSDLRKFVDRDIGFIEFSSMVLWSLKVNEIQSHTVDLFFISNLLYRSSAVNSFSVCCFVVSFTRNLGE